LSNFFVDAALASIRFLIHIFSPLGVGMIGRFAPRDSTIGVSLSMTALTGQPQNSTENLSICHKSSKVMTIRSRSTNTSLVPPAISLKISPLIVKSATSAISILEDALVHVIVVIVIPAISLIPLPPPMICCMLETKIRVIQINQMKNTGLKIRSRKVGRLKYLVTHSPPAISFPPFPKAAIRTIIGDAMISNRKNNTLTRLAITSPMRHHTYASKISALSARLMISCHHHETSSGRVH